MIKINCVSGSEIKEFFLIRILPLMGTTRILETVQF